MSDNLIHDIYNNHNTKRGSKHIFKINCSKATKNINKHILQNKNRQFSNYILHETTYTQHNMTRFSQIILYDLPFLAYEHSEGKQAAI